MKIYGWELLTVLHNPDEFGKHKKNDNEDLFKWRYI